MKYKTEMNIRRYSALMKALTVAIKIGSETEFPTAEQKKCLAEWLWIQDLLRKEMLVQQDIADGVEPI